MDVECRHRFRQLPVALVSISMRTTLRGSSYGLTLRRRRTTPRSVTFILPIFEPILHKYKLVQAGRFSTSSLPVALHNDLAFFLDEAPKVGEWDLHVGDKVVSAEVQTTSLMKKNQRMRMSMIHRERERDRHKKTLYFSIATVTTITTTNLN